jgi:hypothetical protein
MVENDNRKPLTLDTLDDDEEGDFTMHAGGAMTSRKKCRQSLNADVISQNI